MTNPQAVEALPEELAERERFKAWAIEAGLMTAPDESGLCFKSDACRPAWAAWLMRSTLDATQTEHLPEAQALPPEWTPEMSRAVQLYSELGAYAASSLSGAYGLFEEFWNVAHRAAVSSPAPAPTVKESLMVQGAPAPLSEAKAVATLKPAHRFYRESTSVLTACAAGRDGDCIHSQCPQLRDGEPEKTGRHCPLDGIGLDGGM